MSNYPKVLLTEEGMRDGLQIERADIPVGGKIRLLDMLSETGLKEIAVGSFVSPRWVPQMACIDELVKGFHPKPGVSYTATALNDIGRERLRQYIPPLSTISNTRRRRRSICAMCSPSAISTGPLRSKWRAGRRRSTKPKRKAQEKRVSASARPGAPTGPAQVSRRRPHEDARDASINFGKKRGFPSPRSASPIRWAGTLPHHGRPGSR